MSEQVITVSEFVTRLKGYLENVPYFNNVALVGEISNFKAHQSGHFYFSLKDSQSRIPCVMFRSAASKVKFKPKDGDRIVIFGSCQVFVDAGMVQIYVNRMNLDGLGDLHIQFEALRKKLYTEGYFAPEHKKVLPHYPQKIALVTGAHSAAYADMSKTLQERWPIAQGDAYFVYVQGDLAVPNIMETLREIDAQAYDVIVLARGGGSIEDLWAFNNEELVKCIYDLKTPLISGIGHESDVTLVDYVADYRAATPTAAIVSVTPDLQEVYGLIRNTKNQYYKSIVNRLRFYLQTLNSLQERHSFTYPESIVERKQQRLDYLQQRLLNHSQLFKNLKHQVELDVNRLEHGLRRRLYTIQQKQYHLEGRLLKQGEGLKRQISQTQDFITTSIQRFEVLITRMLTLKKRQHLDIINTLQHLSPLQIMARGYAVTYKDQTLIKQAKDVAIEDQIDIRYQDGIVKTKVLAKENLNGKKGI